MNDGIRIGTISSINYNAGTARVVYSDRSSSVTREIPFLSFEYNMPEVGDKVLVLHLSNGAEAGIIIGRPWSEKNKPPEGGAGIYRKDFSRTSDKAMFRYDDKTGTLNIKAPMIVFNTDAGNTSIESLLARLTALESK